MKRRQMSALEAEAKAYHDVMLALNRFWKHAGIGNNDMQRLLVAIVSRWFGYKVTVDIVKP